MDIKIIVATHKKYWMPSDDIYLPVHVGKKGKTDLGYQGDDTGDNISDKNTNYCELTGLYWAWKYLKADYKGLANEKFESDIDCIVVSVWYTCASTTVGNKRFSDFIGG